MTVSLRQHPDFRRLWVGQTISVFGSLLGALGLLAILDLQATPAQMGLLAAAESAPVLLLGLFVGISIDRMPRRPVLIVADLTRCGLLLLAPLLAWLDLLRMTHLYLIAFAVGALTLLFNVAYHAYLPSLVSRDRLVEANSKLAASSSVAEMGAPALGGFLVQLLSAPITMLLDALTFLISGLFISRIGAREAPPAPVAAAANGWRAVWQDIRAGWQQLWGHPVLRPVTISFAIRSFFGSFFGPLYALFVLRELGMTPVTLGLLVGSGGVGAFGGALLAGRLSRRWGVAPTLAWSLLLSNLIGLLLLLARGPGTAAFLLLLAMQLVGDFWLSIYFISEVSLRQTVTPNPLLGRVSATFQFLVGATTALGLLIGGFLGNSLGVRPALTIAIGGGLLSGGWLMLANRKMTIMVDENL